MKLIDINNVADELSWETADSKYDAIVHVELDRKPLRPDAKWIDKFTEIVYSKIEVDKIFNGAYASCICKYCDFFENNIPLWKQYTKKHWSEGYHNLLKEDYDEYIYQLINSLHEWFCGYDDEEGYKELYELVSKCK